MKQPEMQDAKGYFQIGWKIEIFLAPISGDFLLHTGPELRLKKPLYQLYKIRAEKGFLLATSQRCLSQSNFPDI